MAQNPLKCKEYCVEVENFVTFAFGAGVSCLMDRRKKTEVEKENLRFNRKTLLKSTLPLMFLSMAGGHCKSLYSLRC